MFSTEDVYSAQVIRSETVREPNRYKRNRNIKTCKYIEGTLDRIVNAGKRMLLNTVLVTLVLAILVHFLLKAYTDARRDVDPEYLKQQAAADSTRKPGESAVHRSPKLDWSQKLRVGLDIRWNHYKLRNGNMRDIWQLFMIGARKAEKGSRTCVWVENEEASALQLNYRVNKVGQFLKKKNVEKLALRTSSFIRSMDVLTVVIACLVNQITLCVFDDVQDAVGADFFVVEKSDRLHIEKDRHLLVNSDDPDSVREVIGDLHAGLDIFENHYDPDFDRGIAIQISHHADSLEPSVSFTQGNLVSAAASTLRHLPQAHAFRATDKLAVVQSREKTNENMMSDLVKILAALVANCFIVLTTTDDWNIVNSYKPTIISVEQTNFASMAPLASLKDDLNFWHKLRLRQCVAGLSMGIFSPIKHSQLRLIYIHRMASLKEHINSNSLNEYRALLGSRLILENGYPNIAGPFLQSDFFDYRILAKSYQYTYGSVCQSDEIKTVNASPLNSSVFVRGYNIGKIFNNVSNKNEAISNDGFMPIENISKGKWGVDGCLYLYTI